MRRKFGWVLAVVLAALAGALIAAHLHMPNQNMVYRMAQSPAALRKGERMAAALSAGPIEVNDASVEELEKLPGIGPAIARRIVEERELHGPFCYPEDLLAVNGIGTKTLEKIGSQISMNK